MEFAACLAAVVFVLFSAQMGMRSGARAALSRMLTIVLSVSVAMRYWFLASRQASTYESASPALIAIIIFWVIVLAVCFVLMKLCDTYLETFESVYPSILGRILGAIFGCVSGIVLATAMMMTLSLAAPQFLSVYKRTVLPLPVDAMPQVVFRFVEKNVAQVGEKDPAHTPLPRLDNAREREPAKFWQ